MLRQGGFTSSIICSGCGSGSNRTVWMPWCATLINSITFCQCNPALTRPLGIHDWSWHLSADLQGVLLRVCRKILHFLLCTHPQEVILLHWKGLERCWVCQNSWQESPMFFIFSRWSLFFFSFLISFCRFCCYSGFSPAVWGHWGQGQKPSEVLCEGAALQPVWASVHCSFHGAFLSCPWGHAKFWIADSNSLF